MLLSIQVLDFNKQNSSDSFLESSIPTKNDFINFRKLSSNHEDFIENKYEENEDFGYTELHYDDIWSSLSNPIDESKFERVKTDCNMFKTDNNFALNTTNKESFFILLDIFIDLGFTKVGSGDNAKFFENESVIFYDENFQQCSVTKIKEIINKRIDEKLPLVFSFFSFYDY